MTGNNSHPELDRSFWFGAGAKDLRSAINHRVLRKILRPAGIGSIVFGIVAIAWGGAALEDNPLNAILVLMGIFLAIEGIWLVSTPSRLGMIIDGIALFVVGIWNICITFSGQGYASFGALGLFQLYWGIQSFARYTRYPKDPLEKPSDEALRFYNAVAGDLKKGSSSWPGQFIVFQSKGLAGRAIWKGILYDDGAVFLDVSSHDMMFGRKEDVFTKDDKENRSSGKKLRVIINVGERTCEGTISPQSFKTFEAWKGGIAQQSIAQDRISVSSRDARHARLFSRTMLFIALLVVLYLVISNLMKR